jgi:formiminotetrahydrofolate cyclodeaminase
MPAVTTFLDRPLRAFLDELAERSPTPGGGSAAAVTTAMAAGLVAMVARASRRSWPDAAAVAAQAESLRARASPLAHEDARAYDKVLRLLDERAADDPVRRDYALGTALSRAADLPLRIGEAACDVAQLGALVAEHGDPRLRADATAAVLLAEAAAGIAAHLVRVNLSTHAGDERIALAEALADAARSAARRALAD